MISTFGHATIEELLLAIGQEHILGDKKARILQKESYRVHLDRLSALNAFYQPMGGLVGYHQQCMSKLRDSKPSALRFYPYKGIEASACHTLQEGIAAMPSLAEIYPIAGMGSRLGLKDDKGRSLPVALLQYANKTLLEHLIDSVKAREMLFEEEYGYSTLTPIALMISSDPFARESILELFENAQWFLRPKESFFFFEQPLGPVLDADGKWQQDELFQIRLKPTGHGMLWKAAQDQGVFHWLRTWGRSKLLIRQINNPAPNFDDTLLTFVGYGVKNHKAFGFLSCPKISGSAEGVLGVIEEKTPQGWSYRLSNIEYTELASHHIEDGPHLAANTNVLFADLHAVEEKLAKMPFPGLILNQSKKESQLVLESCMQNLADAWMTAHHQPISPDEAAAHLPIFVLSQERRKAITATKRAVHNDNLLETPQGAFYELAQEIDALLKSCHFTTPGIPFATEFLATGPHYVALLHPALGPHFSKIRRHLINGSIKKGSVLSLQIRHLHIKDLHLDGKLVIEALAMKKGTCTLDNVTIINPGHSHHKEMWQSLPNTPSCHIVLHGHSACTIKNCTIREALILHVQNGESVHITEENGQLIILRKPLDSV